MTLARLSQPAVRLLSLNPRLPCGLATPSRLLVQLQLRLTTTAGSSPVPGEPQSPSSSGGRRFRRFARTIGDEDEASRGVNTSPSTELPEEETSRRASKTAPEEMPPQGGPTIIIAGRRRRRRSEAMASTLSEIFSKVVPDVDDESDNVGGAFSSIKNFRVLTKDDPGYVSLDDFRGSPEVKAQLVEMVEMLTDGERYKRVGAIPPKGALFCGETGTGKTYAARAVASAAGVPFLSLCGSDFRQTIYAGVGTSMSIKMFEEARQRAPCVVFLDELDSLGEARKQGSELSDSSASGAKLDQDATLNSILHLMDGFDPTSGVLFIGATNRPEVLDEALVRTGRFERRIDFLLPDIAGREDIIRGCAAPLAIAMFDSEVADLARKTSAFSPADLRGLLNGAAMNAARDSRDSITSEDIAASLLEVKKRKSKMRPEGSFQVVACVDDRLDHVKGHDESVEELRDLVDMLVDRQRYNALGAKPPRGVLMEGPPGVGKTHCARALAGEVGVPFLSVSGSDFQASKYAGQGTQLVKRLFALARKLQPCIVFVDEIDAVGRRRESSARGAEQDRENTLLQLLVEMDGFTDRGEVLVIAATNKPGVLDPALLRPGRFDRRIVLELPDGRARREILEFFTKGKPMNGDVELGDVVHRTSGLSGAELKNIMNEAALLAAKRRQTDITQDCLSKACDRISIGAVKRNPAVSEHARRLTAIHEAGHAILGFAFAHMNLNNVVRVSIRPRLGGICGVTIFNNLDENANGSLPSGLVTRRGCCASLCVDLGGRVAEAVVLRSLDVSSGAASDFQEASRRAMSMVSEWGLAGSTLSIRALGQRCSEGTLREMEVAASEVLAQATRSAHRVLSSELGRQCLEIATEKLLEFEEVEAEVISSCIDIEGLRKLALAEAAEWDSVSQARGFSFLERQTIEQQTYQQAE